MKAGGVPRLRPRGQTPAQRLRRNHSTWAEPLHLGGRRLCYHRTPICTGHVTSPSLPPRASVSPLLQGKAPGSC